METLKPEKLKGILKNLRKGRVYKETRLSWLLDDDGNAVKPKTPILHKRWAKVNPKIVEGIRRHVAFSSRKVRLYREERNLDPPRLAYWLSEYEGYVKILGKIQ